MVIVLLILLIVNVNCCALDQEFIKKTAQKFTSQRSMVGDPIPVESKTSNIDAALLYLQVSRILICDLLDKDAIIQEKNLHEYKYNLDENIIEPASATVKAKIQALPNNKISFFWSFKESKTAYLYYNDFLYKNVVNYWIPSVSDLAVSLDNRFVCGVDNFWKVKVFAVTTDDFISKLANSIFGMQIYDYPGLDEAIEKIRNTLYEIPGTQATSIICTEKNWYCSINQNIYEFQINGDTKKVQNIQKVVGFEKESNKFWIDKLVTCGDILITNVVENDRGQAYFFDLKTKDNNGQLKNLPISKEDQFTVTLFNQQYVLLIDNESNVKDSKLTIKPINADEIARRRDLSNLKKYLAVDINETENRVVLLSSNSHFGSKNKFAPKVKIADFIPTNLKPIIEEFNKQVRISPLDKNNAQKLVQKILNVFYPQSRWQRFYQTAKNNIKWIGLAAVGALGLTTWLYSKNRGSGHNSAAWSKVLTPSASTAGIK